YPSYECYKDIQKQFVEKIDRHDYKISDQILEFEIKYPHNILQKHDLSDVFTNLKKYLSNDHVFGSAHYNGEGTCKYISYLLCDKIRDKHGICDENRFNLLKEFVDKYNKSTNSDMCKNIVNHIDGLEFKKMKSLYEIYDWYTSLSDAYAHGNKHYCSNMKYLVYLYNTFINSYRSDISIFYTLLKNFEGLMNNLLSRAIPLCSEYDFALVNADLYKSVLISPNPSGINSIPPKGDTSNNIFTPEQSEVISSSIRIEEEQKEAYPEIPQISKVSDLLHVEVPSVTQSPVGERQLHQKVNT
ncbi:CYIR protein, partial [Plasmodium cynomolgi strain B]